MRQRDLGRGNAHAPTIYANTASTSSLARLSAAQLRRAQAAPPVSSNGWRSLSTGSLPRFLRPAQGHTTSFNHRCTMIVGPAGAFDGDGNNHGSTTFCSHPPMRRLTPFSHSAILHVKTCACTAIAMALGRCVVRLHAHTSGGATAAASFARHHCPAAAAAGTAPCHLPRAGGPTCRGSAP